MSVGAVLCAAGQGKRMKLGKNKQFLELMGKPLFIHTVDVFANCTAIDSLVLVVGKQELDQVRQLLHRFQLADKVARVVPGGKERQDSVFHGLQAFGDTPPTYILIHDAARPFVTSGEIERLVSQVKLNKAAVLAVPVTDTIKRGTDQGLVLETLKREELWAVQTPQAFLYSLILQAHEQARHDGYLGTDDASLVERLGVPVQLVLGGYHNIKLTTPDDIHLAEYLFQRRREKE